MILRDVSPLCFFGLSLLSSSKITNFNDEFTRRVAVGVERLVNSFNLLECAFVPPTYETYPALPVIETLISSTGIIIFSG